MTTIRFGESTIRVTEHLDGSVHICRGKLVTSADGDEIVETGPSFTFRPEELPEVAAHFVRTWDRQRQEDIRRRTGGK